MVQFRDTPQYPGPPWTASHNVSARLIPKPIFLSNSLSFFHFQSVNLWQSFVLSLGKCAFIIWAKLLNKNLPGKVSEDDVIIAITVQVLRFYDDCLVQIGSEIKGKKERKVSLSLKLKPTNQTQMKDTSFLTKFILVGDFAVLWLQSKYQAIFFLRKQSIIKEYKNPFLTYPAG